MGNLSSKQKTYTQHENGLMFVTFRIFFLYGQEWKQKEKYVPMSRKIMEMKCKALLIDNTSSIDMNVWSFTNFVPVFWEWIANVMTDQTRLSHSFCFYLSCHDFECGTKLFRDGKLI